jgi:hypothetical protein
MPELKIDGNIVELGTSRLVFSKAGYSFEDWLLKDIPYSERVTLPETTLLNSIFGRPFSQDIQGKKFSEFHTYSYEDHGKIVSSGIVTLEGFSENREYELQLLDGSFELFQSINDNLNRLDLEASDFIFNLTSYNTLKVLNSSAWIWVASSMHEDKTLAKNILSGNIAFSRPYFSVKRLIEAMFSAHGWSYELGPVTEFFDKLIISANSEFLFTSYEKSFTGVQAPGAIDLSSPIFIITDTVLPATQLNLTYDSKLRFRGIADADEDLTLQITVSGTDPQTEKFILNKGQSFYDLTSNKIKAGNSAVISIVGSGNVTFTDFLIYTIIDENDFGAMSSAIFTNFKVKTYDNLPEISQKELFKHCLVSIAGFFTTNNFRKKLKINTMATLSSLSAIDWSEKYIEESDTTIPLEGYGKLNYYNYDNSKAKPSNLGRGLFSLDDETLGETEDVYDSIFAASSEVEINDTMIDNTVYDDTERIDEVNDLIGYYEEVLDYTVARFEKLNGNNILSTYYPNFLNAVRRGEIVECRFNLNKSDFFLFDFTKLVFLSQKKSTFYVLRIGNYTDGQPTDVVLLKS